MNKVTVNVMKNRFNIDFFEFGFLVEACLPPVAIARGMFFNKVLTEYYEELTKEERARLHDWITRHPRFDINNEYHKVFEARYNPNNQYLVIGIDDKRYDSFLVDGEYYNYYVPGNKKSYIPKEHIKSVMKL